MLDADTKRRIDSARDILVGKVPDPKSQVEQVTIALIYKFMDDMDREAEELGGKRKFFTGEFAKYGWSNLMGPGLGGHDMLALYSDGIQKMPENPGIPALFRDIFKNAFLPYKDPETLRSFLKVIDEFTYDHSERLGDAFEYLLSVLGSQGDAGQFRTPRHIIDFMVEIMNPTKDDVILDPACGTAGFLISAYKHILKTSVDSKGNSTLTPDDKEKIAKNILGYDISPDMVRLSLVNMYLHGFNDPHIHEYDTLTSEDRWNEFADVILANPPFFSPKKGGAIKPHKRFSIQAGKTEVLFVDYMAEHLKPSGRAAIIVPEGIIFQSGTAYKDLRRVLVESCLVAVISLPAGVFQPYSGVKTSILILEKLLAKQSDTIAFFKIENDGFSLGSQRRTSDLNDLPLLREELFQHFNHLKNGEAPGGFTPTLGLVVPKEKIASSGDYNLSAERYRERAERLAAFPLVPLGELSEVRKGSAITRNEFKDGDVPVIAGGQKPSGYHNVSNRTGETITVSASGAYAGFVAYFDQPIFAGDCSTIKALDGRVLPKFLYRALKYKQNEIYKLQVGMGQPHVYPKDLVNIPIPLPPLEVQKEIVAEIEGYQKVIDGARAVVENYQPLITVHPDWPIAELGDLLVEVFSGVTPKGGKEVYVEEGVMFIRSQNVLKGSCDFSDVAFITPEVDAKISRSRVWKGDVFLNITGASIGRSAVMVEECKANVNQHVAVLRTSENLMPEFLSVLLNSQDCQRQIAAVQAGASREALNYAQIKKLKIPLPPIHVQEALVAEMKAEQASVVATKDLLERMESRIRTTLARVWDDNSPTD